MAAGAVVHSNAPASAGKSAMVTWTGLLESLSMLAHAKKILLALSALVACALVSIAVIFLPFSTRLRYYAENPDKGYHAGFYLYISPRAKAIAASGRAITLLVQPNNSGKPSDDPDFHRKDAWWNTFERRKLANDLEVTVLMPAFIRPANDWRIYTHALDRDALTTQREDISRLDQQLLAMIDDTRLRLAAEGMQTNEKFLLQGYSASGMFVNRFSIMHPERVMAVSVGSPGGWAIAPAPSHAGRSLPYPAGIADLETLTGKPFDAVTYVGIPQMFILGADDDNDSLDFSEGWDQDAAALVDGLFGSDPQSRWSHSENLYKKVGANVKSIRVAGVGHDSVKLQSYSTAFFAEVMVSQHHD